jgi:hypothetical protein
MLRLCLGGPATADPVRLFNNNSFLIGQNTGHPFLNLGIRFVTVALFTQRYNLSLVNVGAYFLEAFFNL